MQRKEKYKNVALCQNARQGGFELRPCWRGWGLGGLNICQMYIDSSSFVVPPPATRQRRTCWIFGHQSMGAERQSEDCRWFFYGQQRRSKLSSAKYCVQHERVSQEELQGNCQEQLPLSFLIFIVNLQKMQFQTLSKLWKAWTFQQVIRCKLIRGRGTLSSTQPSRRTCLCSCPCIRESTRSQHRSPQLNVG